MGEKKVGELILMNIKNREVEKIHIIHFITDVLYKIERGTMNVPDEVARAMTRLRRKYLLLSEEHITNITSDQSNLSTEGSAIEAIESLVSSDASLDENLLKVIKENYLIERNEYLAQLESKDKGGLVDKVKLACKKITSNRATEPHPDAES